MTQLASTRAATGALRISYEEFLVLPPDVHAEWVDGEVVFMPSVSEQHSATGGYLIQLLRSFFDEEPLGRVFYEPFQLRMAARPSGRAPDVMVLLSEHMDRLERLYIRDAADLVVEVVSPSNASTDYVDKLKEYEAAGVGEYWIIDPEGQEAAFFALGADGRFERIPADDSGIVRSRVLPGFWLKPAWLWERPPVRKVIAELMGEAERT